VAKKAAIIAGAAVVVLLAASQLLLPPYLEHRAEDRLEAHGGNAQVDLDAVPALRLVASDGHSISIRGRGLGVDLAELDPNQELFDKLDGFDRVDIALADVRAEPFSVRRFDLVRSEGAKTYRLAVAGTTSARRLSRFAASRLPGLLGPLLFGATRTLGLGPRPIPFDLSAELESEGGRATVVSSSGSVAGIPAGPLAELLANAVISRL
jgi:hypothetical protein